MIEPGAHCVDLHAPSGTPGAAATIFRPFPFMHTAASALRCGSPVTRTLFNNLALSIPLMCVALSATALAQDREPASSNTPAPLLTLDSALSIALNDNRLVKESVLEAEKYAFRVNAARTRRLPQFQFSVLAGELLHPIHYTFPTGAFGTYAETGPIPSTETKISTPQQFTTSITAAVDFPLLQQYKIGLGIRETELGGDVAREGVRTQRQKIAAEVRTAYFDLVATQAAVDAARAAVTTLQESQRVTAQYRIQEAVLRSETLEVDARLAKSLYELSVAENGLATGGERLNELLGRDLTTPFRVAAMPEHDVAGLSLDDARQRAAESRPDIRQADLRAQQADYDRRLARAEYIPDLSVSVRYLGFNNFDVIPSNVTTAGVFLSWEPFDWGRRRHNVAEKVIAVTQARTSAQEIRAQIAVEVGLKYRKVQEAGLLLRAARTTHEAAIEQFRVINNRYKEQASLIRDVLQAEARSTDAQFQYQRALSSYWSALGELRRAMGDE
jgi:outer membrane protein